MIYMKNIINDKYFITKTGDVYSTFSGKMKKMKPTLNPSGYLSLQIEGKAYTVHRLVALAFIDNPENKPQVNHIDGVKTNNDVSNLEWVTNSENQLHAWKIGLQPVRHAVNCCFTEEEAKQIRKEYLNESVSHRELAKKYGVSKTTITDLLKGKYYNLEKVEKPISRQKHQRKITMEQANEIRNRYANENISLRKLGACYNVDHSVIKAIIDNRTYTNECVTTIL